MGAKGRNRFFSLSLIVLLIASLLAPAATFAAPPTDALSVADAIANNSGDASVKGYIVGHVKSTDNVTQTATDDYNFAIADAVSETDTGKMLYVQLPKNLRADWGLQTNPQHLGEKVIVSGNLQAYFSHAGLKNTTAIAPARDEQLASDLFITEYVEGSGYNKAIEIFNGTGETVDLSQYTLELYANGKTTVQSSLALTGELEHGKTLVIYHGQASEELKAKGNLENSAITNFNGDDALVLKKADKAIDSFGQVGAREQWGSDITLVRKSSVTAGNPHFDQPFDPAQEWDAYPKDTFIYLGAHDMDGITDPGEPGDDQQRITIAQAHEQGTGAAKVKGIVTAKLKNTIHIQDDTAGIAVRPTSLPVSPGDEITVSGQLQDYHGLLQLDGADLTENAGPKGVPDPVVINGNELNTHESELATVKKVTIQSVDDGGQWANYTVTDAAGNAFIIRDETNSLPLDVNATYDAVTGIVSQYDDTWQLIPRGEVDIVADESVVQPVYATPNAGRIPSGSEVTLASRTPGATIYYTTDGSNPVQNGEMYTAPIKVDKDMTIKAVAKKDGLSTSRVTAFAYRVYDAAAGMQIHDIQGAAHESPLKGSVVENIEGIVTYQYDIRGANYFHMQAPENKYDGDKRTSEGLVVYTGKAEAVAIGDLVSVSGKVDEYHIDGYDDRAETDLPVTQINARDDRGGKVTVLQHDVDLPDPVKITSSDIPDKIVGKSGLDTFEPDKYAIDYWESLEGMLVAVEPSKAVAPQQHGDLAVVTDEYPTDTINGGLRLTADGPNAQIIQFKLYPNNDARDFAIKTGDKFTQPITGVVNYGFSNYKVYADLDKVQEAFEEGATQPRPTTIEKDADKLTVASYNVENFSANTSGSETPDEKAQNVARAFVQDMHNPDIVGLLEIQDNNGQAKGPDDADASESYARLIQEIEKAGGPTYAYANIDPEYNQDGGAPDANIRVGFLYNPARVSMVDGKHGTATEATSYENGKLTLNPGRIDPMNPAFADTRKPLAAQFEFNGESVVVVANHLNSKRGDEPAFGKHQPPVLGSEAQRVKLAKIVNGFVKDIEQKNPDEHVIVLGDMNDFEFSRPLQVLQGDELTNMVEKVPEEKRYSYVFQGNSQVLDHLLVSNNLADATQIDMLHINADFTEMHGRASDHDPVLAQIDLRAEKSEPVEFDKIYKLKNYHANKLMVHEKSASIEMDAASQIRKGIYLRGHYAQLQGKGLAHTTVTLQPKNKYAGAVADFKGEKVAKVVVWGSSTAEIRGAENIREIAFVKGAKAEDVVVTDSSGKRIGSPEDPAKNQAPVLNMPFESLTLTAGETATINLADYFSDPDGDRLTFASTIGDVAGSNLTLQLDKGDYIVAVTASDAKAETKATFAVTVTAKDANDDGSGDEHSGYYADAYGKTGASLKASLHHIIKQQRVLSYSQVWDALKQTDEDPANPDNVILLYSGKSRSKNASGGQVGDWNREHVWAKSHGNFGTSKGPGTDLHHLRPTDVQVNSARGNKDFDNGGSSVKGCDGCKMTNVSWEPPNRIKGDVARMLFYMAVRYEAEDKVDLELNEILGNGSAPYMGKLSTLLEWNEQDPVDDVEMHRNDVIEELQGNRNPFIDHPEWADAIWEQEGTAVRGYDVAS